MLTLKGKIVLWSAVGLIAISGWVARWYWPTTIEQGRPAPKMVEASTTKEAKKWPTRAETREIKIKEAPEKTREEAKAKPGDELLTAVSTPPAPHGGTAQAWLNKDGGTRILFRPNPRPAFELGGSRMLYVGFDALDPEKRQLVGASQRLGRIGSWEGIIRIEAENRRGDVGWKADFIAGVTF